MISGEITATQQSSLEISMSPAQGDSKCFDDDGRLKRTGTFWTASAHMITAVIGSGVLSLAWATAQLGWLAAPSFFLSFALVTYYTSCLLASCYRSGDPVTGRRNYTYMDAVQTYLGDFKVKICGAIQYLNLFGMAIGYTIAASISMAAVRRSNCFHDSHAKDPCHFSNNIYMLAFGAINIFFSQIPHFHQISWLSIVAAVMSFTYSLIGLALGISKVAETGEFKGSLTGISIGTVTQTQKIWRSFQALGAIAFACSYSLVLIEIEDTIKSPPSESKIMKKATGLSVSVTTVLYMMIGCFGYAAFGDLAPKNLLTGFGFYNPFWLVNIANIAIVVHLVGAYQVSCQPLFSYVEKHAATKFPQSTFINKEYNLKAYKLNLFRLVWRILFVMSTTIIPMVMPFFENIAGILGAIGFWPLTVYFPVEMYIVQAKIPKWSSRWISLQMLSVACLIISIVAAVGSFAGVVTDLKAYKPFQTNN
ncbi:hypothetical protein DCAR_0103784 [Daucus carota subsp. sativus]|uniref:Amino acid transporter transmembrane domain-containing protein n=2 Tax=Daucus carota subsp. sativus TaxID=79200 RepID=A0A162B7A6_DAUCS|nr:PREDICTED: amino acid permease 2-like [Daucus carota subsp. sativus]WOG84600.1 hypothetical protein DCAR_0103784 [Daucus carota subsp. sativus]